MDDHELLRDGMRMMISHEPDLEVCGEAEDETEALRVARETRPDLAIVDLTLKSGDGLDLIKQLKVHHPSVRAIVSSRHDERLYGERALRAGAKGYVNKQESARTLITAIRHVMDGKLFFSEELAHRVLLRARLGGKAIETSPIDSLSDRELQVFRFIGQGLTTGEIAQSLLARHKGRPNRALLLWSHVP